MYQDKREQEVHEISLVLGKAMYKVEQARERLDKLGYDTSELEQIGYELQEYDVVMYYSQIKSAG